MAYAAGARTMASVVRVDKRTGKLVRTMVPVPQVQSAVSLDGPETQKLDVLIEQAAKTHEVEAPLIRSVIRAESNYNPLAVSNKGAQGLMQLIPSTAKRFGVKDSFDSKENVEGGTKYLKYLITLFHGDYERAIAAYNAGEAAVAKYGGVPPYKETREYVAQVAKRLASEREALAANQTPDVVSGETPTAETYRPVVASVMPDGRVYYRTP
jgi:soluble lytic murein transglycosylase-like protein